VAVRTLDVLWLRQIVPDLLAQRPSRSASQMNLPTNPVHVLDLAFYLPAAAASGVLLLRRHRWGYTTAAAQLTFVALTCLPIMVTTLVAAGPHHEPGWAVIGPVGVVLLGALGALWSLLGATRPDRRPAADPLLTAEV